MLSEIFARAALLRVAAWAWAPVDLVATFVPFTGFAVTLVRLLVLVAFLERLGFLTVRSLPWNSRTIRWSREK